MAINALKKDEMLASIKSTFTVEGKTFDTKEEAEKYFQNQQKIKEASKKLVCFFKKTSIHDRFSFFDSKAFAIWLYENRHQLGEVLVDFGAVEHLS